MRTYSVAIYAIAHSQESEEGLQARLTEILKAVRSQGLMVTGFNVRLWTGDKRNHGGQE